MATHFNPRSSQAPIKPKGLFQKIGEAVGQMFGLRPMGPASKAHLNTGDQFVSGLPYAKRVQIGTHNVEKGMTRLAQKQVVPDPILINYLDQMIGSRPVR